MIENFDVQLQLADGQLIVAQVRDESLCGIGVRICGSSNLSQGDVVDIRHSGVLRKATVMNVFADEEDATTLRVGLKWHEAEA